MRKLVLVDGSSYIYRAYYALPPLTSPKGEPTGAVYGFIRMISKLLNELNPDYIAVIFDAPGKTFRHEEYKEYKAQRKETPDDLRVQIPKIKEIIKLFGIKVLEKEGYEADDIIATLAKKGKEKGFEVYVVTPDKDMLQLVEDNIYVLNPVTDKVYNREKVKEKYGIYPEQFIDYLAIVGDPVDNIIGVKGVGPKTAAKLLQKYGSLKNILKSLDKLPERIRKAFEEVQDKLEENMFLVKLKNDVPLEIDVEDLKKRKTDWEKLLEVFEELGFKSLLKELSKKGKNEKEEKAKQKSLF